MEGDTLPLYAPLQLPVPQQHLPGLHQTVQLPVHDPRLLGGWCRVRVLHQPQTDQVQARLLPVQIRQTQPSRPHQGTTPYPTEAIQEPTSKLLKFLSMRI